MVIPQLLATRRNAMKPPTNKHDIRLNGTREYWLLHYTPYIEVVALAKYKKKAWHENLYGVTPVYFVENTD